MLLLQVWKWQKAYHFQLNMASEEKWKWKYFICFIVENSWKVKAEIKIAAMANWKIKLSTKMRNIVDIGNCSTNCSEVDRAPVQVIVHCLRKIISRQFSAKYKSSGCICRLATRQHEILSSGETQRACDCFLHASPLAFLNLQVLPSIIHKHKKHFYFR